MSLPLMILLACFVFTVGMRVGVDLAEWAIRHDAATERSEGQG
jgi:hypothetical protein